jgi:ATP-binding cassette, subfamily G (WHITE), member 2, PDR
MADTSQASSISPDDTQTEDGQLDNSTIAQVAQLARTFSQASHVVDQYPNPFLDSSPTLDPKSPKFDAKEWARCLLGSFERDPEKYPRQPIGVSWRDLSVHGFGKDTDYQKDVLNVLWQSPMIVRNWISARKEKIQILRDFDGIVKPGEMVLVLGRPGR